MAGDGLLKRDCSPPAGASQVDARICALLLQRLHLLLLLVDDGAEGHDRPGEKFDVRDRL